jgi:flagellar biosynthetic protein FliO
MIWLVAIGGAPEAAPWPADGLGAVRGFIALLVVFGLLGLFVWLARRGSLGPVGLRRRPGGISVETAVPLGERRSLAVVAVEGRRLLLGLTPAQVTLVAELSPKPPTFAESLDGRLSSADGRPS